MLITAEGPRWTDFETACRGPREWDIGFLPGINPAPFAPIDRDLLDALADLRSLCVAVWCFALYDVPEKREAAISEDAGGAPVFPPQLGKTLSTVARCLFSAEARRATRFMTNRAPARFQRDGAASGRRR